MASVERTIIARWNSKVLDAIREEKPYPTVITRGLHMVHAAMYDAWAAYQSEAAGSYTELKASGTEKDIEVAVSVAAYEIASKVFKTRKYIFDEFVEELNLDRSSGEAEAIG